MELGFWFCMIMVPIFWIFALFFAVGKEKAANWLSGFHYLPETERAKYDRERMAKDCRNNYLVWGTIMLLGAMGSLLISGYVAVAAYLVWGYLFFKDVHWDTEKAFGKYKL